MVKFDVGHPSSSVSMSLKRQRDCCRSSSSNMTLLAFPGTIEQPYISRLRHAKTDAETLYDDMHRLHVRIMRVQIISMHLVVRDHRASSFDRDESPRHPIQEQAANKDSARLSLKIVKSVGAVRDARR